MHEEVLPSADGLLHPPAVRPGQAGPAVRQPLALLREPRGTVGTAGWGKGGGEQHLEYGTGSVVDYLHRSQQLLDLLLPGDVVRDVLLSDHPAHGHGVHATLTGNEP